MSNAYLLLLVLASISSRASSPCGVRRGCLLSHDGFSSWSDGALASLSDTQSSITRGQVVASRDLFRLDSLRFTVSDQGRSRGVLVARRLLLPQWDSSCG